MLPFPDLLRPYLSHLEARYASATTDEVIESVKTGQVGSWRVPDHLWPEYLLYGIVEQLNGVFESFRFIVADIEQLPANAQRLQGRPSKRPDLHLRTFHGEAFRGREVIRRGLGEMRKRGILAKEVVKGFAAGLDDSSWKIESSLTGTPGRCDRCGGNPPVNRLTWALYLVVSSAV